MKKKIFKGLLFFLIGFILFFGFRLLYGYLRYDADGTDNYNITQFSNYNYSYESSDGYTRKNIASSKYKGKEAASDQAPVPQTATDQKYEKIGTLSATTKEFESTEKKTRGLIEKYNALIQYELKSGLTGNRYLNLVIGVPPENFDAMVSDLKKLGKLGSIQIDKLDKTSEFRELEAKRISLEKTIASLNALKAKSGKIDEYVNLEQQILEYERELQELGVMLGDYSAENEFCTIKYNLTEDSAVKATIPFIQRALVALEWTVKYYFVFMIIILLAALSTFLLLKAAQMFKWIRKPPENGR